MKKRLLLFLVLLISPFLIYNFYKPAYETGFTPASPPVTQGEDEFLISSLNIGQYSSYNFAIDTLGYNLWHRYLGSEEISGKRYPTGWTGSDLLFADRLDYIGDVQDKIDEIYSYNGKNTQVLLHRPKIEYLCYGQRSDYQCEAISN